jgi:hypothetical protein
LLKSHTQDIKELHFLSHWYVSYVNCKQKFNFYVIHTQINIWNNFSYHKRSSLNDSWRINSIITFGFTYQYIIHNSKHLCHYRSVHNDLHLAQYRNFWWMSNFLLHTHNCFTECEYFHFYTQSTENTSHWPVYIRQMLSWFIKWKHNCLILTHKLNMFCRVFSWIVKKGHLIFG